MKRRSKGALANRVHADEILPEYDFEQSSSNKFASRYAAGSAVIVLEPDVAAAFPSSGEANEALRALAGIIQQKPSPPTGFTTESLNARNDPHSSPSSHEQNFSTPIG